jgi:hypothetical protein
MPTARKPAAPRRYRAVDVPALAPEPAAITHHKDCRNPARCQKLGRCGHNQRG